MRFKVGQKVQVVAPYTFSGFKDGDIVEISKIIDADSDFSYYEAKPCNAERGLGYLNEDELEPISMEYNVRSVSPAPITNGDKIRAMSNRELADMLLHGVKGANCKRCPHLHKPTCTTENSCIDGIEAWLNSEAEDE